MSKVISQGSTQKGTLSAAQQNALKLMELENLKLLEFDARCQGSHERPFFPKISRPDLSYRATFGLLEIFWIKLLLPMQKPSPKMTFGKRTARHEVSIRRVSKLRPMPFRPGSTWPEREHPTERLIRFGRATPASSLGLRSKGAEGREYQGFGAL